MNLRNRAIASIGAAALLASTVMGAVAADDGASADVNVKINKIENGTVSVSVAESALDPFNDLTYSFDAQTSEGDLVVGVLDERGTAGGWTVTLGASNFNGLIATNSIGIDNLALVPGAVQTVDGNAADSSHTASSLAPVTVAQAGFWTAPQFEGDGAYQVNLDGTLQVPAGTLVDEYKSTVTVEITGAQP
jgi:hypothetical protein